MKPSEKFKMLNERRTKEDYIRIINSIPDEWPVGWCYRCGKATGDESKLCDRHKEMIGMKKSKQNRYAKQIGVSVMGSQVFSGKRKKITSEEVKERISKYGEEVQN